jgi:putative glycosyltransferase (TIGR04348 family)
MQRITIITPARADANNGNWHTASRWSHALQSLVDCRVQQHWDRHPVDAMIALHARRSADSIDACHALGGIPIALVLTGTDLYRDIATDASARRSLDQADLLVVLQAQGLEELPAALRSKARVIEQSASRSEASPRDPDCLNLCMVGHARAEKDPMTALRAFGLLQPHRWPSLGGAWKTAALVHVGRLDEPVLDQSMRLYAQNHPGIALRGALTHSQTRQVMAGSAVLLLPSIMEGGANVLIEAVCSGASVLASDAGGNRGLLGNDYPGLFTVGDASGLAALIERYACDLQFRQDIDARCAAIAMRFDPQRERDQVQELARDLLALR